MKLTNYTNGYLNKLPQPEVSKVLDGLLLLLWWIALLMTLVYVVDAYQNLLRYANAMVSSPSQIYVK
jgi:hypothetical protein